MKKQKQLWLERKVVFGTFVGLLLLLIAVLVLTQPSAPEAVGMTESEANPVVQSPVVEKMPETSLTALDEILNTEFEALESSNDDALLIELSQIPETAYESRGRDYKASPETCALMGAMQCPTGQQPFSDTSGCGCVKVEKPTIEIPDQAREKYYVGDKEQCQRIRYRCEEGWDYFADEMGCGCEKIVDPAVEESVEEQVAYPLVESTWGNNLNPENQVPRNQWQAFYFSTEDPSTVVESETVDRLSVNFGRSKSGIDAETFAAYWVGDWEFEAETVWELSLAQGWSSTRLIIDNQLVYEGDSSHKTTYVFTPGVHRVEVEYINGWHTVGFSFVMGEPVNRVPKEQVLDWLYNEGLSAYPLAVASTYESNRSDTRIPLEFAPENEPVVLVLNSYEGVEWGLDEAPEWLKGVVVGSYEKNTRVSGLPEGIPLLYLADFLNVPYRLQPDCNDFAGHAHCEHTGIVAADKELEPLFGKTLSYFTGAYNTPGLKVPNKAVTPQLRQNIESSYLRWKAEKEEEAARPTSADFDALFD